MYCTSAEADAEILRSIQLTYILSIRYVGLLRIETLHCLEVYDVNSLEGLFAEGLVSSRGQSMPSFWSGNMHVTFARKLAYKATRP